MPEQFSYRGLRGPKADVLAKVKAGDASDIAKAWLTNLITAVPCDAVTLDCHAASDPSGGFAMHIHLGKLY